DPRPAAGPTVSCTRRHRAAIRPVSSSRWRPRWWIAALKQIELFALLPPGDLRLVARDRGVLDTQLIVDEAAAEAIGEAAIVAQRAGDRRPGRRNGRTANEQRGARRRERRQGSDPALRHHKSRAAEAACLPGVSDGLSWGRPPARWCEFEGGYWRQHDLYRCSDLFRSRHDLLRPYGSGGP